MRHINDVLHMGVSGASSGIEKRVLCKFMLSDRLAVHYVKQCTGEGMMLSHSNCRAEIADRYLFWCRQTQTVHYDGKGYRVYWYH